MPLFVLSCFALPGMAPLPARAAEESDTNPVQLSYPEEYRETGAIFEAISKQPLIADMHISKAELVHAYNAAEKPFQHRNAGPGKVAGAHAPEALTGNSPSIMLWGPYVNLEHGQYLIVYRFQLAEKRHAGTKLFLDVAHNACTRSGIRLEADKQPVGQWQEIAVPVTMGEAKRLEFRFWPAGNPTSVDRVYVFKVVPRKKEGAAPEELPAGRKVDARDDVLRSPHTEDNGMIDVSGLTKGTKVLCPYTGKYFRVP